MITGNSRRNKLLGSRLLLVMGFGAMLIMPTVLFVQSSRRLAAIDAAIQRDQARYFRANGAINELELTLVNAGTHLRDFLLEPNGDGQPLRRAGDRVRVLLGEKELRQAGPVFEEFVRGYADYWTVVEGVLGWDAERRQKEGYRFLREQGFALRSGMLDKTGRLRDWNSRRLEQMEQQMRKQFEDMASKEKQGVMVFLLAGMSLAGFVYYRVTALSREAATRLGQAENLSARLLRVQEEERKAVARELHDGVAQNLSALKLGLDRLGKQQGLAELGELRELAEESLKMTRNLSLLLRPSMLDDLGLEAALRWQVREWQRVEGLLVELQTSGELEDLDEEKRLCVFRVVQEAVQNAMRHGQASEVQIQVAREPQRLLVSVQDNGRSFDPAKEKGLGIMGMTERVEKLGGTLSIASRPGVGTVVMAELR